MKSGKMIVFSAPSGSGKTTLISHLLQTFPDLEFSISATSRPPRGKEINGKDYHFLDTKLFKKKITNNKFIEHEEVYPGTYYGTLNSELEKIWNNNKIVIFDLDVVGGLNIKKQYPKECLSIFIMPPSIEILAERLIGRGSESDQSVKKRLDKAEQEISKNKHFDTIILNDDLKTACKQTKEIITNFINT
jgi:guanylate kinase